LKHLRQRSGSRQFCICLRCSTS